MPIQQSLKSPANSIPTHAAPYNTQHALRAGDVSLSDIWNPFAACIDDPLAFINFLQACVVLDMTSNDVMAARSVKCL